MQRYSSKGQRDHYKKAKKITVAAKSTSLPGPVELLQESWKIYQNRFVVLVLIILFTSLPGLLNAFTGITSNNPALVTVVVAFIVNAFFTIWGSAALIYAIKEKNIGFVDSLRLGIKKLLPLVLLNILVLLIIVGGLILLIVPGIIFMVWFAFSQYVLINENSSITDALKRSREYVKGKWWAVFGRLLFLLLLSFIFMIPSAFLGAIPTGINTLYAYLFMNTAVSAVLTPLSTIYLFLLYTNLKSVKS